MHTGLTGERAGAPAHHPPLLVGRDQSDHGGPAGRSVPPAWPDDRAPGGGTHPLTVRARRPSYQRLRWTAPASLILHAAVIAAIIYAMDAARHLKLAADAAPMVELRMIEAKGRGQSAGQAPVLPDPTARTPPSPPAVPSPPVPPQGAAAPHVPPPPPAPDMPTTDQALLLPPPPPATAPPAPPQPPSPARQAHPAAASPPAPNINLSPEINLGGTDSLSNVLVSGDQVIPAGPDPKVHNREPVYPLEAARRGEHGTVLLAIHVSPEGLADDVMVARSSGFRALDRAARDAVATWRFVPAVRDGQAIASVMTLRVVFDLN
jgi:protein TonB